MIKIFKCPHCHERKMVEVEDLEQPLMRIGHKVLYRKLLICTNCKYKIEKQKYDPILAI